MKRNLISTLILVSTLISCTSESDFAPEKLNSDEYPQTWKLVKMSGSFANSETSGNDMDWQEYYRLNSDNTFLKFRVRKGSINEATGTFTFITLSDGEYLELLYASGNNLIGNCTGENKEYLSLRSDNRLIGTWNACDGPGLEYERVE